jgi:DNA-binding response OmpR family regulator
LIVEDNQDVVDYLVEILSPQYTIVTAANGADGLAQATEIIPDMILTDVMMPRMDGLAMLKQLKTDIRTDHIPVVVLTARGDPGSKIEGLDTGADHYLVKPFREKELLLVLHNLLEARRKMQQRMAIFPTLPHPGHALYQKELQFMTRINDLLDQHLSDEDFGIQDICASLNISRPQLYRKFSALLDRPVGQYIRSYRLLKAKALIEYGGTNVTEAAMQTGFKSLSHFSTSFREEFGYPPSELLLK